jgi:hypothetical protein
MVYVADLKDGELEAGAKAVGNDTGSNEKGSLEATE